MQGTMLGARRRGRPRTAWMDNIKTWIGLSVEESVRMTEDRDKWKKVRPWCGQPSDRGRLKNRRQRSTLNVSLWVAVVPLVVSCRCRRGRRYTDRLQRCWCGLQRGAVSAASRPLSNKVLRSRHLLPLYQLSSIITADSSGSVLPPYQARISVSNGTRRRWSRNVTTSNASSRIFTPQQPSV